MYTDRDLHDVNLENDVQQLLIDIYGWKEEVDKTVKLVDTHHRLFRGNMHLHMNYHLALIYLCRPFMLYKVQQSNCEDCNLTPFIEEMSKLCVEAATQEISLLQFMEKVNILGRYSGSDLTFCVQAVYVLLANSVLERRSESCLLSLQNGLQCLRNLMGKGAKAALDLITNLERLIDRSTMSEQDTTINFSFYSDIFNYESFEQWADDTLQSILLSSY